VVSGEIEDLRCSEIYETSLDRQMQMPEDRSRVAVLQVPIPERLMDVEIQGLKVAVCVQGHEHRLPDFALRQLQISMDLAKRYQQILCPMVTQTRSERELSSHLSDLTRSFSRSAAETAALLDADNYEIPDSILDQDVTQLRELGSFNALVKYHNDKQKETGLNVARVREYLAADPNYAKIAELVDNGVVIDTAADFVPTHRTAKFRNLQLRMLTVHRKAVVDMHGKNKVLLFRISDIPPDIYATLHTANEYHWRPEPGKIAGRPLLDCSNCAVGEIPLNSEETKDLGIQRYQKVHLPTFTEVLVA